MYWIVLKFFCLIDGNDWYKQEYYLYLNRVICV